MVILPRNPIYLCYSFPKFAHFGSATTHNMYYNKMVFVSINAFVASMKIYDHLELFEAR